MVKKASPIMHTPMSISTMEEENPEKASVQSMIPVTTIADMARSEVTASGNTSVAYKTVMINIIMIAIVLWLIVFHDIRFSRCPPSIPNLQYL